MRERERKKRERKREIGREREIIGKGKIERDQAKQKNKGWGD